MELKIFIIWILLLVITYIGSWIEYWFNKNNYNKDWFFSNQSYCRGVIWAIFIIYPVLRGGMALIELIRYILLY